MRTLLTTTYPAEKGNPEAQCDLQVTKGAISLSDPSACHECRKKPSRYQPDCNMEGLRLYSDNQICILRYDRYIKQFYREDKVPSNCDYLIFDDGIDVRKVAFCDLTCSTHENVEPNTGKYPEGKRAKCRTQMQASLNTLAEDELLAARLFSIPFRVALFAWREYTPTSTREDKAIHSMKDFARTASSRAAILTHEAMSLTGQFKFVEVHYPAEYNWTEAPQDIATYIP